jgi:sec-independent protein translocase protein TatA
MGDLFTPVHLIIVLGIALLVFGPKRLPELGAGLGRSLREFREATNGMTNAFTSEPARPIETPTPFARPAPVTAPPPETANELPQDVDTGG